MNDKKLVIVYTTLSPASTFVLGGVKISGVECFPLLLRPQIFNKAIFKVLFFLRLYKVSAIFRYQTATYRNLKHIDSDLLCWDCSKIPEYVIISKLTKAKRKTIFFWNLISMWGGDEWLRSNFARLKQCGFRLCSFDPGDCKRFGLNHLKYVNRRIVMTENSSIKQDFYFVGLPKGRDVFLHKLENTLREKGFSTKFLLIESHKDYISQYDNIVYTHQSRCIVDICVEGQEGLTLRPIDALFVKRKLITNNKNVKQMDFYHPDNIYVIEDEHLCGIEEFMRKPYHEIPNDITNQYEINNWIMNNFMNESNRNVKPLTKVKGGGKLKSLFVVWEGGRHAA